MRSNYFGITWVIGKQSDSLKSLSTDQISHRIFFKFFPIRGVSPAITGAFCIYSIYDF